MSNQVNILNLKRKEIRKYIGEGENRIEIYNPSPEQKNEILKIIAANIDDKTGKIKISGKDFLLKLIPMLTNIYLDIENNPELIETVLNDPSDILLEVQDCINDIVKNLVDRTTKNIKDIADLPEDVINEIFNIKEELTDEEKKTIEKAKRMGLV
jgi:predicted DNA binding protein